MNIRFTFLIFFILITTRPAAQTNNFHPFKTNLQQITTEDGLSQSTPNAILKDKKGYMWIGTSNGLNRYDGSNFTIYKHDDQDHANLASSHILSLFEDSKGRLWAGTYEGVLSLYKRRKESFTTYLKGSDNKNSLTNNSITDILEYKPNQLWLATNQGITIFNVKKNTFKRFYPAPDNLNSTQNRIFDLMKDSQGRIWAGTGKGVILIKPGTGKTKDYMHNPEDPGSLSHNKVLSVFQDSQNRIWLGTEEGGVNLFKPKYSHFKRFKANPQRSSGLNSNNIQCISEDKMGNIWFGTDGGGISIYNPVKEQFFQFKSVNDREINHSTIRTFYKDHNNLLWIGTFQEGIKMVNFNELPFSHFLFLNDAMNQSNNSILSLTNGKDSVIWIGTDGAGLYKLNPINKTFKHYQHQPGKNNTISGNVIKSLLVDEKGNLFAGTYTKGLNKINLNTGKTIIYNDREGNPASIGNNSIWALNQDSRGNIWVGTLGDGLYRFNRKTGNFNLKFENIFDSAGLQSHYVQNIFEDNKNRLWVGTLGGLLVITPEEDSFRIFSDKQNDPGSISHNHVGEIFQDSKDNIWIGTLGGGLNRFKPASNSFEKIPLAYQGSKINFVQSILEDRHGNLWMGTLQGLCRYNPEKNITQFYNKSAGVQGKEFNQNAALIGKDNKFYFGGRNGLNYFKPDNIQPEKYVAPLIFTDFALFHNKVEIGESTGILQENINLQKKITLDPGQNIFSVGYTALNFNKLKEYRFSYKLEGFDNNWHRNIEERRATYTNLPPGNYILKVKAANNNGIWSKQPIQLKINILPPWYKVGWVQFIMGILGMFLIIGIIRLRTKFLSKQKQKLEDQVQKRTRQIENQKSEMEEQKLILERQNQQVQRRNKKIISQNKALKERNEEITAQREQIEQKSKLLEEAHQKIQKTNEELKKANNNLEYKVSQRTMELQDAIEKLMQTDEELNIFLYRSSHDLRAPVASVLSVAELALSENTGNRQTDYLEKIRYSSQKMLRFLQKLNDTNLVFKTNLDLALINFQELTDKIINDLKSLNRELGDVKIDIDNNIVSNLKLDRSLIKVTIQNLVENAITFKSNIGPYCRIQLEEQDDNISITISDNGIGIPENIHYKIFKMFYRGSEISKGNGLGLYMVHRAVSLMNGQITINSQKGKGTEVKVTLPLHPVNKYLPKSNRIPDESGI